MKAHIGLCVMLLMVLPVKAKPLTEPEIQSYITFLKEYEGFSAEVYTDSYGDLCVGIGHNLSAHRQVTKQRYYNIRQINRFFNTDLEEALVTAHSCVWNFDQQPEVIQRLIVGVIWTVGDQGFRKFYKFRLALGKNDYRLAASELRHSLWFTQVQEERSRDYITLLTKQSLHELLGSN